jgi:tRNA(Ile)-lysidine synthase
MNLLIDISKKLKSFKKDNFLLALSGGLDSISLFYIFLHLKQNFAFNFSVVHFHHGFCEDPLLLDFRFNAYELVKKISKDHGVAFFCNYEGGSLENFYKTGPQNLKSESDFRQARYAYLNEIFNLNKFDKIVLAHQQDDLLETRIIRMIRGVGPEGLRSMSFKSQHYLRPLLTFSRQELKNFVMEKKGGWLEDPSNNEMKTLRNWLRKKWLKDLEEKKPGSLNAFSRSLDLLLENVSEQLNFPTECINDNHVNLSELLSLNESTKKQVIATYMKGQGLKNYGLAHVNEVLKRLDTEKKHLTFTLLGHSWIVDAGRMSVQKID